MLPVSGGEFTILSNMLWAGADRLIGGRVWVCMMVSNSEWANSSFSIAVTDSELKSKIFKWPTLIKSKTLIFHDE
jgi:hypothetical protein